MKSIPIVLILVFAGGLLVFGCVSPPDKNDTVGNDTDSHGCKLSAGYSWCDAKQKCIRPWEEDCTISNTSNITNFQECVNAGYPILESYPAQCQIPGGQTFYDEGMNQTTCQLAGGHWNECGSACRGAPEGSICTMQCVGYCECGGIAGFGCPQGYECTDYLPVGAADAMGVCKRV